MSAGDRRVRTVEHPHSFSTGWEGRQPDLRSSSSRRFCAESVPLSHLNLGVRIPFIHVDPLGPPLVFKHQLRVIHTHEMEDGRM